MDILIILVLVAAGIGAITLPLLRGRGRGRRALTTGTILTDDQAIEREIERYRIALRSGTLCRICHFANPEGSSYCADCGRRLRRRS